MSGGGDRSTGDVGGSVAGRGRQEHRSTEDVGGSVACSGRQEHRSTGARDMLARAKPRRGGD